MFNLIRIAALVAAGTAATTAVAAPYDLNAARFERAGYKVDARYAADHSMQLTGHNAATNSRFRVTVSADNHVTGVWDGQPIDTYVGKPARTAVASIAGQ